MQYAVCKKDLISEYEIIFVDDASDDRSNQVLNELRLTNPRIQIHKTTRSFGNAECLRYAIKDLLEILFVI